jgi:nitroimidazol reductase NimA-like FMN-containing flavoprotein (pyridoxamine 5'-phosphate oxidase superfamily)
MQAYSPSDRTRVHRIPARASYDKAVVHAILDEALFCHVGFVGEDGQPIVIPTIHARIGERLVFHGAKASRLLAAMTGRISVTVTLVDGLVLARSHFHHSMNYRSVVVLGVAEEISDPDEKRRALDAIVQHVAPGRLTTARPPDDKELRATRVLSLALEEVSAKIRTGPPLDDAEDMDRDCWAGVVPLRLVAGEPIPAPDLRGHPEAPRVSELQR